MVTFGKRLKEAREAKGLSQKELAQEIGSINTVIGRYEKDKMKPSIDVVKKLAEKLETTVGYLIGEIEETQLLRDPVMLRRFQEINKLNDTDKECLFTFLDAFLAKHKLSTFLGS